MSSIITNIDYGCWISPENRVENASLAIDNVQLCEGNGNRSAVEEMFHMGYVKIKYSTGSCIELTGMSEAIKRAKDIWSPLTSAVEKLKLHVIKPNNNNASSIDHDIDFAFPKERIELENYLGIQ